MPIDSHIHLYPEFVFQDVEAWAAPRQENYWLSCVKPASGKSLQAWKTVDELLLDMDAAAVEKAVILAWYWENDYTCNENLDWQLKWFSQHPDRFVIFAPFNAKGGSKAIDRLKRAFDSGVRGIGEINPPAQQYRYDDPTLQQAIELAAKANAAVNFHVTDPATRDYPGKIATDFDSLYSLAAQHPATKFIFSHLGGLAPLTEDFAIPKNIWFDTAACPLLYDVNVYRKFCDKVGSDRILFGTDYPLRVFPRTVDSPDFITPLQQLENADLSKSEIQRIIGLNAKNLLNL